MYSIYEVFSIVTYSMTINVGIISIFFAIIFAEKFDKNLFVSTRKFFIGFFLGNIFLFIISFILMLINN